MEVANNVQVLGGGEWIDEYGALEHHVKEIAKPNVVICPKRGWPPPACVGADVHDGDGGDGTVRVAAPHHAVVEPCTHTNLQTRQGPDNLYCKHWQECAQ